MHRSCRADSCRGVSASPDYRLNSLDFALSGLRRAIDKAAEVITGVEGYFLYRQHSVMGGGTPKAG